MLNKLLDLVEHRGPEPQRLASDCLNLLLNRLFSMTVINLQSFADGCIDHNRLAHRQS